MPVYLFLEQDNPKDKTRMTEYRKWVEEDWFPYIQKKQEEGVCKMTGLSDNTGHVMALFEFEDMEALAKIWDDEKYHRIMIKGNRLVDNLKIRLCRPSIRIPP